MIEKNIENIICERNLKLHSIDGNSPFGKYLSRLLELLEEYEEDLRKKECEKSGKVYHVTHKHETPRDVIINLTGMSDNEFISMINYDYS